VCAIDVESTLVGVVRDREMLWIAPSA
jgi:hypothetical protein